MEEHWQYLFEAYLENRLTEAEAGELRDLLRASAAARRLFWDYFEQHALIEDVLGETRGRDLALAEINRDFSEPDLSRTSPPPAIAHRSFRWFIWAGAGVIMAMAASFLLVLGPWRQHPAGPANAPEALALAKVRSLSGDVQVIDPQGKSTALATNASLSAGQVLHVGEDESQAEIVFDDGTQVVLGPGTNIKISSCTTAHENCLYLEKGALQVQTTQPTGSPMIVTTDHARITAAETRFRLYRESKASRVELEEGKVLLARLTDDELVEVREGSFVVATDTPAPMIPQPLAVSSCRLRHTLLRAGDAIRFSPDGRRLVASHFSRGLKAWDTADGALLASARGSGQRLDGLAFIHSETVIGLGNAGAAMFWKIGDAHAKTTGLWDKQLRNGAVSADGRWLAQASSRGEVAIWEADADRGSISLRQALAVKPSQVALSRSGTHVAVGRWGGELYVFEVTTGREVAQYRMKRTPTPLSLSPNSRFLAAYANDEGLVLFDRETIGRFALWAGEGARVNCLEFSADNQLLLAGLADGTVRGWCTRDGSAVLVLDTGHRSVQRATLTADGALLGTVGDGDCVKIWDCKLP